MKKSIKTLALLALLSPMTNIAQADETVLATPLKSSPFIAAEGNYTWSRVGDFDINIPGVLHIGAGNDRTKWGGRVAAGYIKQLSELLAVSSEIGWGYYGKNSMTLNDDGVITEIFDLGAINVNTKHSGFDVLMGLYFNYLCYDFFFKAGALIENSRTTVSVDFPTLFSPITTLFGNVTSKSVHTEALPLIKLGASYYFDANWALTAAWTHAFGARAKFEINVNPDVLGADVNLNFRSPTLNIISLGLQYNFC